MVVSLETLENMDLEGPRQGLIGVGKAWVHLKPKPYNISK